MQEIKQAQAKHAENIACQRARGMSDHKSGWFFTRMLRIIRMGLYTLFWFDLLPCFSKSSVFFNSYNDNLICWTLNHAGKTETPVSSTHKTRNHPFSKYVLVSLSAGEPVLGISNNTNAFPLFFLYLVLFGFCNLHHHVILYIDIY